MFSKSESDMLQLSSEDLAELCEHYPQVKHGVVPWKGNLVAWLLVLLYIIGLYLESLI